MVYITPSRRGHCESATHKEPGVTMAEKSKKKKPVKKRSGSFGDDGTDAHSILG